MDFDWADTNKDAMNCYEVLGNAHLIELHNRRIKQDFTGKF